MKKIMIRSGTVVLAFLSMTVGAADFDGSKPLLCAAIHATGCDAADQSCESGAPWMQNFPVFMELDFKAKTAKTVRQHQNERASKIEVIDTTVDGNMSLQGTDGAHSWSMIISEETGSMTLVVAAEDTAFIVFGACTPDK